MNSAWLLVFASVGVASGSYRSSDDLESRLDAYSRAANLQPLKEDGDDELRVWTFGYMSREVEGYAISRHDSLKCQTRYVYDDGVTTIAPTQCRRWHRSGSALRKLDALAAMNGKEWDCPLEDGGGAYVEGLRGGKRFAFRVTNPWACKDSDSKLVLDLLDALH
jgi:hypothetical protein